MHGRFLFDHFGIAQTLRVRTDALPPGDRGGDREGSSRETRAISAHQRDRKLRLAGIGASAGGMDAVMQLLAQLPRQANLACILAHHQASDGQSELLLRQLARRSQMEVSICRSGQPLLAGHVYLIPAGQDAIVQQGKIVLQAPANTSLSTPSVDVLFQSIAHEFEARAIGIVLSGAGSDGLAGCRSIRAQGGRVLAQDAQSARFYGMPGAVIRAGLAQHVMNPVGLALQLDNALGPETPVARGGRSQILEHVLRTTGIDFRGYKPETLDRRIQSRMTTLKCPDLEQYASQLARDPAEAKTLQRHLLVSLSCFFRDRPSFRALQDALKQRLAQKPAGQAVRIWTPGCASGEETYTMAMVLGEILGPRLRQVPCWILGTDLNPAALAKAGPALYSQDSLKEMEPDLIQRTLERVGQQYRVREPLRSMCHFRCQDVMGPSLPSNLDLISCRNLLIYLQSDLQAQLIGKFHQALARDGLLFIGPSETLGAVGNALFRAWHAHHRVYRRRDG